MCGCSRTQGSPVDCIDPVQPTAPYEDEPLQAPRAHINAPTVAAAQRSGDHAVTQPASARAPQTPYLSLFYGDAYTRGGQNTCVTDVHGPCLS
jgi:hypothetical protein